MITYMYSYQTTAILKAIKEIPEGKVDTYGGVAMRAGIPNGARQVVRILSALSDKEGLAWHRVVNKEGRISLKGFGGMKQELLLAMEDVTVKNGIVDLIKFGF